MEKGSYKCSREQVEAKTDHDNAKDEKYKVENEEKDTNLVKTVESKWNYRQARQFLNSCHASNQVFR